MTSTTSKLTALAACLAAALLLPAASAAAAEAAPAWAISATPAPANLPPGSKAEVLILAANVGAAPTDGSQITIEDTLPPGLTPIGLEKDCTAAAQTVTCTTTESVRSSDWIKKSVVVEIDPLASGGVNEAAVQGGGAPRAATVAPFGVSESPAPFDFLPPGLQAPLTAADGSAETAAGAHPYQQTVEFIFPSVNPGNGITNSGHPHDVFTELPAGLIGDPAATPRLCSEAQLEGQKCPESSQIGIISVQTLAGVGLFSPTQGPLYNMVPPAGHPAELGADVVDLGLFLHLLASVRTDGDYGIEIAGRDTLAFPRTPILGVQAEVWGNPSAAAHDPIRGKCSFDGGSCPVEAQKAALLTMPGSCPGQPITTSVRADTWEEPGLFKESRYESADLNGAPVSVNGCNQLSFEPTITSQPTTNLADSPSGLQFDLHQPQDFEPGTRATAQLKDARVTLPEGMVANPSQAGGLEACTEAQIGYLPEAEEAGVHFSKQPQSCPNASKLGTLEVSSPLLAEYTEEGTKLLTDPETGLPVPRPLHGSVYLAKPFANPFGSLLAIYLAVEDPRSGIVAKLGGKVEPDPATGRLTTVFEENPQLPLEDVRLHLFEGARASLITPPVCGTHSTTTELAPWTSPEGTDAHPASSFEITQVPGGGTCPTGEAAAHHSPAFTAGTESAQAGAFSPFVLKLSREDGSQRLAGIDTVLAPGLSGKLAGIAKCPAAQILQAEARRNPEEGKLERESPSCPASSQLGVLNVGAGAGPTPFYTQGHAYLAGPYKGAPLSLAVIVPAVAGPFDLGTVVSRVALHVEPQTAQIHAVSDPLPQILYGIPLDVRSVALRMERPSFTLNPTSCDPMAITGSAISAFNQSASLNTPFQVGGCQGLPFKPKLSLRLRGGTKRASHPKLIATLKAKAGEANIAKAQVKLPPSAFLDQGHIRTICTRVQFAADACPPGSIYGKAQAITPLLDEPLTGNVYLRSSNHKLPDLVVALKGPDSLPIEIELQGRTDSVKGALRNTFEAVPDAPVSSFRLELFGGKRGLVVNSRNLCARRYRAEVQLEGQNGKGWDTRPVVRASCKRRSARR
jgi:hypothetical protein